jgi:DNA-directed RNA polymerase specialized sigma24 family protein
MRKIREVLRLRLGQGLPQRAVAQSLRLSQGAVHVTGGVDPRLNGASS